MNRCARKNVFYLQTKNKIFSGHSLRFLLFAALLVCVIPLTFLTIYIYKLSVTALHEAVLSSAQSETTFYATLLDEEINQIRLQQFGLVSSEATRRLNTLYSLTNYRSEEARMVKQVDENLASIASISPLVQSSLLYLPQHRKKLSSKEYLLDLIPADVSHLEWMTATYPNGIYSQLSGVTLWASYPFMSSKSTVSSTIILTSFLSGELLSNRLNQYTANTNAATFILYIDGTALFYPKGQGGLSVETATAYIHRPIDGTAANSNFAITYDDSPFFVTYAAVGDTGMHLIQAAPENKVLSLLLSYQAHGPIVFGVMALLILMLTAALYKIIYAPIAAAQSALRKTEAGDFSIRLSPTWAQEFQDMFEQFNHMAQSLQTHIEREYQFQRLVSNAEMKQLQYQISPHFLYNTYFILRGILMQGEYDQATELAALMGRYLKYIVHVESPYAILREEITHARAYADIQQIRFGHRIKVAFDRCPQTLELLQVPRLILQPLIENAFAHGVKNIVSGGLVAIRFVARPDAVDLIVEDNGTELTDDVLRLLQDVLRNPQTVAYSGGIALQNINQRIHMTYGAGCGLQVDRSPLGGLRCVIHIEEVAKRV